MRRQHGFTLIELLMVVWIITILAAVAVPAYSDYMQRTRVVEGLVLSQALKSAIEQYYAYHGRLPADNKNAAVQMPAQWQGHYVKSITINHGTIEIDYQSEGLQGTLQLQPQINPAYPLAISNWQCRSADLNSAYLPSACK